MPELPDVTLYLSCLKPRIVGQTLQDIRFANPFVLRSVDPPPAVARDRRVSGLRRIGKRIVIELEGDLYIVIHLMIAGRFRWLPPQGKIPGKLGLAALDFPDGTLLLTEAGTRKRASIYLVRGEDGLKDHDPGGLEVLDSSLEDFRQALTAENHTVKRALTDPRLFSGIGNAYSDEILHRARLSPVLLTRRLDDEQIARLHGATRDTLRYWIQKLQEETGPGFPVKVTAFREGMAVHGRYRQPCPDCGSPVQRIAYADNETNYCATCQNAGRLLADRSLSRLMKDDWPRSLDELEESFRKRRIGRGGGQETEHA